jgi:hypothetical protein
MNLWQLCSITLYSRFLLSDIYRLLLSLCCRVPGGEFRRAIRSKKFRRGKEVENAINCVLETERTD